MIKILVNTITAKSYSGGAFQISINFVLKTLEHKDVDWYYVTSKDLDERIGKNFENLRGIKYFVFPTQPDFRKTYRQVKRELSDLEKRIHPDVIYSITAPSYFSFEHTEVMRFTNGIVTHPNKYSKSTLSFFNRLKTWLYCKNQIRLIRNGQYFITQTETTKAGILRITGLQENHVRVVGNVLPSVFSKIKVCHKVDQEWFDVACVGNPVPHKNFDIIPDVLNSLYEFGVKNVRFHTTIPFDHPLNKVISNRLKDLNMSQNLINHGRITQKELAEVYQNCQFCFLPTLLEVFSASTVEAMYFQLPTVATNFSFNSEIFEDSCLYYTPKDYADAAKQLFQLIADKNLQKSLIDKMKIRLTKFGDYDNHFNSIKDFLIEVANNSNQ